MFQGNGFKLARIELFHTAGDFLLPGCFDGFVIRVIEALDQRACEFGAFRHRESECLFQEVRCFSAHGVILHRKGAARKIVPPCAEALVAAAGGGC